MCARYVFFSGRTFGDEFGVVAVPDLTPRYNIAPTQQVPGVVSTSSGREFAMFQWGLVPSWSKDPQSGSKLINARSETVAEKPSFRSAFKNRRCLIPADGFYEWKGEKGSKQPYYITTDRHPFAFAGIWETWEGPEGLIQSCSILTTSANELLSQIHDRMPVILKHDEYDTWLDIEAPPQVLTALLDQFPTSQMSMHPVTTAVGNSRFDDPSAIEEVPPNTLF